MNFTCNNIKIDWLPFLAHIRDLYTLHDFSRDNGKYNGRSSECLSEAQFRYSVRTDLWQCCDF